MCVRVCLRVCVSVSMRFCVYVFSGAKKTFMNELRTRMIECEG